MKHAKSPAFLISVILLCFAFLTCSAPSAFAEYFSGIAVRDVHDGILTLENGEQWYKVKQFEDDAEYIMTVQNDAGEPQIFAVSDDTQNRYIWCYYR